MDKTSSDDVELSPAQRPDPLAAVGYIAGTYTPTYPFVDVDISGFGEPSVNRDGE